MEEHKSIAQFDHFIPVSTSRLITALVRAGLSSEQVRVVHKIRRLITLQYSDRLIKLKRLYQPFNPDRELLAEEVETIQSADTIQQVK
ncbi:MAG: hypothetical protein JAY74_13240, partial [Candidatus Thiodiazotropha taylori]|nr:hypothetical protein [Candidatus Thiodiazotropha taylori]